MPQRCSVILRSRGANWECRKLKWRHHVHVSKKPPKSPGRSRAPRATSGRQDAELSAQAHVKALLADGRIGTEELDRVCMALISKLVRRMCEENAQQMEVLRDPRLIRLAVARAKSTGDLQGSLLDAMKALRKLQRAEHARKRKC